ncbi:flagellar protein FlgN [bacterium]|nr:flagellar protein FlgN [bacterium]
MGEGTPSQKERQEHTPNEKPLPERLLRKLHRSLKSECDAYRRYLLLLKKQRNSVTTFQKEELEKADQRCRELLKTLEQFHQERVALIDEIAPEGEKRLSHILANRGSQQDKRELLPLVEELRRLIEAVRKEAQESQSVQTFALNVVNGSLSILMRATKNVSKQYGRQGEINESFLPRSSRSEDVLKKA